MFFGTTALQTTPESDRGNIFFSFSSSVTKVVNFRVLQILYTVLTIVGETPSWSVDHHQEMHGNFLAIQSYLLQSTLPPWMIGVWTVGRRLQVCLGRNFHVSGVFFLNGSKWKWNVVCSMFFPSGVIFFSMIFFGVVPIERLDDIFGVIPIPVHNDLETVWIWSLWLENKSSSYPVHTLNLFSDFFTSIKRADNRPQTIGSPNSS